MTDSTILSVLVILLCILCGQLVDAYYQCQKKHLFMFERRKYARRIPDRMTGGRRATDCIRAYLVDSAIHSPKKQMLRVPYNGQLRIR
jgi:hypothetical protein